MNQQIFASVDQTDLCGDSGYCASVEFTGQIMEPSGPMGVNLGGILLENQMFGYNLEPKRGFGTNVIQQMVGPMPSISSIHGSPIGGMPSGPSMAGPSMAGPSMAGPPKIKSGWGGNMDFNKLSNELQSDLILLYYMDGCPHCVTAKNALENEINSGKVIVKDSSEAAKDGHKCSGYPCFVAHTGNKEGFTVGGQMARIRGNPPW